MPEQMDAAVRCLYERKNGLSYPRGHRNNDGCWYPDASEFCEYCQNIHSPARGFPFALYAHCKGDNHVAGLFGVNRRALLKALAKYEKSLITVEKET